MSHEHKLLLENLSTSYGKRQILHHISCEFRPNKITAILGQSGCGKSTLLKSINRIAEDDGGNIAGSILLDGASLFDLPLEALRKRIGLVFQQPVVFPCSVIQNLLFPLQYHYPAKPRLQRQEAIRYLEMTGLYEEVKAQLDQPAFKLSGGQQQRMAIARCLCTQPDILMLDEPCSALDMKNTLLIEQLLTTLKQQYTVLIVTHNVAQAKRIADYILFMDGGELVEAATAADFFSAPKSQLAKEYIGYMDY